MLLPLWPLLCIYVFFECMHCSCCIRNNRSRLLYLVMIVYLSIYLSTQLIVFAFMHRFWNSWCWWREVDDTTRDCSVHRRQEGCLWMSINNHSEFTVISGEPYYEHLFVLFHPDKDNPVRGQRPWSLCHELFMFLLFFIILYSFCI